MASVTVCRPWTACVVLVVVCGSPLGLNINSLTMVRTTTLFRLTLNTGLVHDGVVPLYDLMVD